MTSDSERDRSIERMLRGALRVRDGAAAGPSCINFETLAAWVDGGLSREDAASLEAHAAGCSRCQALVAALAKTAPAPVLRERRWRSFLVPVAVPLAAAAVIILAVVVTRQEPPLVEQPSQTAAPGAARDRVLADESRPDTANESLGARTRQVTPDLQRREAAEGRERAAAAPPSGPATSAPAAAGRAQSPLVLSDSASNLSKSEAGALDVPSSDPLRRWRVAPGRVDRSTDGGATWITPYADGMLAPLAAASPSPDVLWVVGRAGMVLVSSDGRTVRRVIFPESADLTAVRATDATTATVVTADGRSFLTTDAGLTWVPAPLQEFPAAPF